nr:hypothetical protein BaRGS_003958 [Batillaria attramentaria]
MLLIAGVALSIGLRALLMYTRLGSGRLKNPQNHGAVSEGRKEELVEPLVESDGRLVGVGEPAMTSDDPTVLDIGLPESWKKPEYPENERCLVREGKFLRPEWDSNLASRKGGEDS